MRAAFISQHGLSQAKVVLPYAACFLEWSPISARAFTQKVCANTHRGLEPKRNGCY
jgi:hypothetical protein